jgi:hypothetical protein
MRIEKHNYSHAPWRLVDDTGREIDYIDPEKGYTLPVCAATKGELVEKMLKMCDSYRSELASARLLIKAMKATSNEGLNAAA